MDLDYNILTFFSNLLITMQMMIAIQMLKSEMVPFSKGQGEINFPLAQWYRLTKNVLTPELSIKVQHKVLGALRL